jgi:hypothetical protein
MVTNAAAINGFEFRSHIGVKGSLAAILLVFAASAVFHWLHFRNVIPGDASYSSHATSSLRSASQASVSVP